MSTALSLNLPKSAGKVVTLAIREHQRLVKEHEEGKAKYDEIDAKIDALIVAHIKANFDKLTPRVSASTWQKRTTFEVHFKCDDAPAEVVRLLEKRDAYSNLKFSNAPHLKDVIRRIRDKLAGVTPQSDRVNKLLADPAIVKSLDATLAVLRGEDKTKAIAA